MNSEMKTFWDYKAGSLGRSQYSWEKKTSLVAVNIFIGASCHPFRSWWEALGLLWNWADVMMRAELTCCAWSHELTAGKEGEERGEIGKMEPEN